MISFDTFSPRDGIPIYLQIIMHVKQGVASGTVQSGDELPSRRVLSALLGVNPNTVQKAYRLLEEEGLVSSHTGAKSCVVLTEETVEKIKKELLESDARSTVASLKQMGLTKAEALALIENYWD